jgi:two-component system nitrogen regulation response regulator GlnG
MRDGSEKGAFTDSKRTRKGLFELADGGTLFLDEIGEMAPGLQAKLLRVIETREVVPVGATHGTPVDIGIVAASHRDLQVLVSQGLFREDLFYRLNVVPIRLPALRERIEDIPALAQHFLAKAHGEGLPLKTFEPEAMARLKAHAWPGNVRELENLVRRLAVLYPDDTIGEEVIVRALDQSQPPIAPAVAPAIEVDSLGGAIERHVGRLLEAQDGTLPQAGLYGRIMREVERPLIARALSVTRGNQLKAADLLGLNRNTLRKKIRELDIQVLRSP